MAPVAAIAPSSASLLTTIAALREHFGRHFDRGWLAMTIDDLPIDFATLRLIREMLAITQIYSEDRDTLEFGLEQLERFAADLRRYLLPVLKERLGVSGLAPLRHSLNGTERVHRQLLYHSFPYNLSRLEDLTAELRDQLHPAVSA